MSLDIILAANFCKFTKLHNLAKYFFRSGTDPMSLLILLLLGRHSSEKPNTLSFQIVSGWNLIGMLFSSVRRLPTSNSVYSSWSLVHSYFFYKTQLLISYNTAFDRSATTSRASVNYTIKPQPIGTVELDYCNEVDSQMKWP